ncbi:MAG: deoxyribonuclease V [Candidatus Sumerlaeia bacterium]
MAKRLNPLIHPWDVTPTEAVAIQKRLREHVVCEGKLPKPRLIAGADISWGKKSNKGFAGMIVFTFPGLEEVERVSLSDDVRFPYVPGLLTFREGPLLMECYARLRKKPDLIFFDGQGMAHPRRMGVATHLGMLLDIPAIGCAKSRLVGEHREPGPKRGNRARLLHHDETIGYVLRTRDGVKPIFVSVGHRLDLAEAIRLTLRVSDGFRVPKPTRLADHFVGELRREYEAEL